MVAAVAPRARRRRRDPGRGRVRRAVRAHRLQRRVHRQAGVSRDERASAVLACGALALHVKAIAAARMASSSTSTRCRPSCTTGRSGSRPRSGGARGAARGPVRPHRRSAYADCGSRRRDSTSCASGSGAERLPGEHCYDVFAGAAAVAAIRGEEPGTYFLTDFLVKTFDHLVWRGSGSTGIPTCATRTSATTGAWCGWRRSRRRRWRGRRGGGREARPAARGARDRRRRLERAAHRPRAARSGSTRRRGRIARTIACVEFPAAVDTLILGGGTTGRRPRRPARRALRRDDPGVRGRPGLRPARLAGAGPSRSSNGGMLGTGVDDWGYTSGLKRARPRARLRARPRDRRLLVAQRLRRHLGPPPRLRRVGGRRLRRLVDDDLVPFMRPSNRRLRVQTPDRGPT